MAEWQRVDRKSSPEASEQVLVAYRSTERRWHFEVLIHWPDGVWTDYAEQEVDEEEMPILWRRIEEPSHDQAR